MRARSLLPGRVPLVVLAHHIASDGAVADEGGVVDADPSVFDPLEELPHSVPVDGPAVPFLHPLVHLLHGERSLLGAVLVWGQLHHVVAEKAGEAYLVGEGRRGTAALATDECGHALQDIVLAFRVPEDVPLGVAVGVYEAGEGPEAFGVDGFEGVPLDLPSCRHLIALNPQ